MCSQFCCIHTTIVIYLWPNRYDSGIGKVCSKSCFPRTSTALTASGLWTTTIGRWSRKMTYMFPYFFPLQTVSQKKSDCNDNFIQALQIIKATDCIKVRFKVRVERLLKFAWLSWEFTSSWIFLCRKHHCKKKTFSYPHWFSSYGHFIVLNYWVLGHRSGRKNIGRSVLDLQKCNNERN